MSLPDQTPKLPKLPFLIGDAVLLAAAWLIFDQRRHPLDQWAIIGVVACVAVAAVLGAIPFLSDYARKQDEALDERQRGLEALSRTVNTSAEQISIAANGLHEITELAHKNLKHAEQLPQKLHEQIAAFNAQIDNAREDDREELEKELAELRASETERLQSIADKVHKAVSELTKLDVVAQKHLTARTEFLQKTADTISQSQADANVALHDAAAAVTRELAAAQTKAVAAIDTKLAESTSAALAAIAAAVETARTALTPPPPPPAPALAEPAPASPPEMVASEPAPEVAAPPKRPRKSRREEPSPALGETATALPADPDALQAIAPEPAMEAAPAPAEVSLPTVADTPPAESFPEPAPVPAETIAAVEPVAPASADPFPPASEPPAAPAESAPTEAPAPVASPESINPVPPPVAPPESNPVEPAATLPAERPAKKRARKPDPTPDLLLDLGSDELVANASDDSQVSPAESMERVISSDGATRLIATAYIGIGNRLFIRGDGPGLSWEKGVPLQFVSIGKWRWETSDATGPIAFKLYKNDEIECALGRLSLDPGHQQEVTARF